MMFDLCDPIIARSYWVIMTKDRKYMVKGVGRNRTFVNVLDRKDRKRPALYNSYLKAYNLIKEFDRYPNREDIYGEQDLRKEYNVNYLGTLLIPVEMEMQLREVFK